MAEYIDREAVKEAIGFVRLHCVAYGETKSLLDVINEIPAADVEPIRHGRWTAVEEHIYLTDGVCKEWTNFYCSICDTPNNSPTNYCPNCGAKMDEVSE